MGLSGRRPQFVVDQRFVGDFSRVSKSRLSVFFDVSDFFSGIVRPDVGISSRSCPSFLPHFAAPSRRPTFGNPSPRVPLRRMSRISRRNREQTATNNCAGKGGCVGGGRSATGATNAKVDCLYFFTFWNFLLGARDSGRRKSEPARTRLGKNGPSLLLSRLAFREATPRGGRRRPNLG